MQLFALLGQFQPQKNFATIIDSIAFCTACHAEGRGFEPRRSRHFDAGCGAARITCSSTVSLGATCWWSRHLATPAASFSRTPSSRPRASPRSRASACGPRGGRRRRWLGGHDRLAQGESWQAPARRRTHAPGRGAWPARRSIKSFVYNDPAELERADDLVVRRPIAGKNHAD